MSKRLFTVIATLALLLVVVPAAFAQYPSGGVATTNAVIQNTSSDTANVVVQYYKGDGALAYNNPGVSIGSGAVKEIKTADEPLPAGFNGTAVVSGDKSIAAIVSIKYTGVPADADGKNQGAYNGFSDGATAIYFPSMWRFSGIVSTFTVMNTESSPATVNIEYFDRSGNSLNTRTANIPGYAGKTYSFNNPNQVPGSFDPDGSVTVTSSNKLAGASTAQYSNRAAAYQALTDADRGTTLYASSHFRFKLNPNDAQYTLFSAVNIQNTSSTTAAQVDVKYYNRDTGALDLTVPVTIPAGSAAGLNTRTGGDKPANTFNPLGTDWAGSVVIESKNDVDIVGTVVTQWGTAGKAGIAALTSAANASNKLYLPAQYRLQSGGTWNQWSSINLQNVGTTTVNAADLIVRYVDTNGNTVATFTGGQLPGNLAPGAAMGLNTRNGGDLNAGVFNNFGNGFIGGTVIEAPAGAELIATVNIVYKDRASVYNAFAE